MNAAAPALIVSLHDFHPGSRRQVQVQRDFLRAWGVTQCSILAVPQFHHGPRLDADPTARAALTTWQAMGDEIVLHGYYHDRREERDRWQDLFWTRLYTNREAEFWKLTVHTATQRLAQGQQLFADCGWRASGFIAPGWLIEPTLFPTLSAAGFSYTTLWGGIVTWPGKNNEGAPAQLERSPTLCYSVRSMWRRFVSRGWNALLARRLLEKTPPLGCIRLALHPADLEYCALRAQIERLVRGILDRGYVSTSYAHYVTHSSSL